MTIWESANGKTEWRDYVYEGQEKLVPLHHHYSDVHANYHPINESLYDFGYFAKQEALAPALFPTLPLGTTVIPRNPKIRNNVNSRKGYQTVSVVE